MLDIRTTNDSYGVNIPFKDGLVILRADNTSGKSTCIDAIIYALGLERMLFAQEKVPLPHVMTSLLEDEGEEIEVLESDVFLEISNRNGDIITIKRAVKNQESLNTRLISVWEGAALSEPTCEYKKHDYYVRDAGSAKHEKGFYRYLTSFLGWDLPMVRTYDSREVPLYMECIFPLLIVEQKRGWSNIQSNMPTFYRIKDVNKRSIEFIIKLDTYELSIKKQALLEEKINLKNEWKSHILACENMVHQVNGTVHSLPSDPIIEWPPKILPYIEVYRNDKSLPLKKAIKEDKIRLSKLQANEIPSVKQAAPHLTKELEHARDSLEKKEIALNAIYEELSIEKSQVKAIESRIIALKEDLRRNTDIQKIRKYGSKENFDSSHECCPACHQKIPDYLFAEVSFEEPMSIDDNIKFIKNQSEIFKKMRENTLMNVELKEKQIHSLRNEVNDIRSHIRALKQTLISSDTTPSISVLRERILLDERVNNEAKLLDDFEFECDKFYNLSKKWKSIVIRQNRFPDGTLSNSDFQKIHKLEMLFNQQLELYKFGSFSKDIKISPDTYKPTLEGFNLSFDISASDNIRTIWAYLCGLLEVAREYDTNHPGLLIFDEPRQQDADESSYIEFLRRSACSKEYNQQIIIATSEKKETLEFALDGYNYDLHDFPGKIIKNLSAK
jgi:hypothetical protein